MPDCYFRCRTAGSSQYSEGPATGHLDTGFSWFPCVYKQMLRWFPKFQVATTCFSCSPPDLFVSNQFRILHACKITTATGWQLNCSLLWFIIIIIIIIIINSLWKSLWTCPKANYGLNEVNDEIVKGLNGSSRLGSPDCCISEACICF